MKLWRLNWLERLSNSNVLHAGCWYVRTIIADSRLALGLGLASCWWWSCRWYWWWKLNQRGTSEDGYNLLCIDHLVKLPSAKLGIWCWIWFKASGKRSGMKLMIRRNVTLYCRNSLKWFQTSGLQLWFSYVINTTFAASFGIRRYSWSYGRA